MNKLETVISKCKASITLRINDHKDVYQTVKQYLDEEVSRGNVEMDDISKEVRDKMEEMDSMVYLHFYPRTPVSFYSLYHYDLDMALDEGLEILKEIK